MPATRAGTLVVLALGLLCCATIAQPSPKHLMLKRPCKVCGGGSKDWPGHLKPMGQQADAGAPDEVHADAEGQIPLSPQDFYRKYVREVLNHSPRCLMIRCSEPPAGAEGSDSQPEVFQVVVRRVSEF